MWKEVFTAGPFTSFNMIKAISSMLGIGLKDILADPKRLKDFSRNSVTKDNISSRPLYSTWASDTGRCTSFAIKVATQLERKDSARYSFKYYDVRKHRIARCERTGVLIDSSSPSGAVVLRNGEEWTNLEGLRGR